MNYDDIFEIYYTLYRAEADTPASSDDEYKVGIPLANVAIRRWANYDSTYWNQLFTTAQQNLSNGGDGDLLVTSAVTYAAPSNMLEAGGFVRILNPITLAIQYSFPIIDPQEAQFRNDLDGYCYFSGDPNNGFVLHLNPLPQTPILNGLIEYNYYKQPTLIVDGNTTVEMQDPMYIVHSMLANRFRASRNPYYTSAQSDAEDVLKSMQAFNNSGSYANPWQLPDNSGSAWGA